MTFQQSVLYASSGNCMKYNARIMNQELFQILWDVFIMVHIIQSITKFVGFAIMVRIIQGQELFFIRHW
jgi:hypothetical protein